MSGWFRGSTGRWYSGQERAAMAKKSRAARARGEHPVTGECNRCGQTEGRVSFHNHDYSHPTKYLEELCWRCHMVVHAEVYAPEACERYWEQIKQHGPFPPLPFGDFKDLVRRHGIVRPKGFGKIMPPEEVLKLYNEYGFRKDSDDIQENEQLSLL
jgi:hypothetical protein